ncbi:NifU family protein [Thioclava sp.]|uniref:NifU family protein n=1 Tax=Thioclava sp. TaxID=1933450 RepID=UPI003AA89486
MSEAPTPRRIRAQASTLDAQTMRFILEAPIPPGKAGQFDAPDADVPLAVALFAIDGVRKLTVSGETIVLTCAPGHDWGALKAPVAAAIRAALAQSDQPLGPLGAGATPLIGDAALLARTNEVLDTQANPSIAKHGGRVSAESVKDGVVYLRMSGGCHGCAASSRTLREGVERILRAALPAIRDIIDLTDHASGENPFYQDGSGQPPTFTRIVPPEHIAWKEGALTINPDYLAPRLGLARAQFLAGLESGEVTITNEAASGTDTDITLVIVRTSLRAWAAEVLADGTAREVPPPRLTTAAADRPANALSRRVRAHLAALPTDKLPITYVGLARALGLYAPGSVRKITAALEVTMREDAAAGRAFIAARAVSRGPAQSPGQGFFELALALGQGPRSGETEAEFHHRQMVASGTPA